MTNGKPAPQEPVGLRATLNPAPCAAPPMGPSPGYAEVTIDRNVAQEPVADDDAIHDFLREIYGRAFKEGAESTVEQWHAERSGRAERWPEAPSMPHKDCENEGSYQFGEDVKPKLLALLDRLQAKAPETGEG